MNLLCVPAFTTRLGGTLLLTGLLAQPAFAGSFGIAPTGLELNSDHRIEVLTVHNHADASTLMQVRAVAWSQREGEDHYEETREILVAPPVFELAAGADQVVRVALRRNPETTRELSYRVFVQEVPSAVPLASNGLRIALQVTVPVFVTPLQGAGHPELHWQARRVDDGLRIAASNAGNVHARVQQLQLDFATAAPVSLNSARYVLPGSEVSWQATAPATITLGSTLAIRGLSDLGEFTAQAALSSP